MVADCHRLGFPLLAGSSLPVTWRLPDLELPYGCEIEEALMIGVGGSDAMDYNALEAMQCMIERRRGGETGVASVQLIEGKKVWGRPERRERTRRQRCSTSEMVGVRTTEMEAAPEADPPAIEGPPTMEEQQERQAQERERTEKMVEEEIQRAPRNLDSYQQQKLLNEDEANKLRELYGIDQRLADGEIDEAEAQRLREEIGDAVREKLQARLARGRRPLPALHHEF